MPSSHLPVLAVVALAGTLAWTLVACGGRAPDRAEDTGPSASPSPTSTEDPMPPSTSPAPSGAVAQAVADLAERLGVQPGDVEVVSTEEVTWRDGSRGCAEPGMMYTQALIDGSRITLGVDGTTYEYHSGGSGPPTLCDKPTQ